MFTTLWNIIMAINLQEENSCTLQISREHYNMPFGTDFLYSNLSDNKLIGFAVEMMIKFEIPILLVDLTLETEDDISYMRAFFDGLLILIPLSFNLVNS